MKNGIICRIIGGGIICVAALILYEVHNLLLIPIGLRDTILDNFTLLGLVYLQLAAGFGLVFLRIWGVYMFFIAVMVSCFVTVNLIDLNDELNQWQQGDMISLCILLFFVLVAMVAGVIFFFSRQSFRW